MERRDFLKLLGLGAMGISIPAFTQLNLNRKPLLILIELKGGNDGLNTVVPFGEGKYYQLRPSISIKKENVIPLNNSIGLNKELSFIKVLLDQKHLSIIQNVGYPTPNLSHFRSIDIWETASDSNIFKESGWLADALNQLNFKDTTADAVSFGGGPGPIRGSSKKILIVDKPNRFLKQSTKMKEQNYIAVNDALAHILSVENNIHQTVDKLFINNAQNSVNREMTKGKGNFVQTIGLATQLINKSQNIPIIKLAHEGFDTHIQQPNKHQNLLKQFNDGIELLVNHLKKQGMWDNTLIMTYSEFGRRVAENDSLGTDHGTANTHFVIGGKVKSKIIGPNPNLLDLSDGNLNFAIDYRQIYATILNRFWGLNDRNILKNNFEKLDFL